MARHKRILNYTSRVPASKSIAEIEGLLVEIGATGFQKEYLDKKICGLKFIVELPGAGIKRVFSIPAKPDVVYSVMTKGRRIQKRAEEGYREQAERTAWRIVRDWVEVQCTMVRLQQADAFEVFLPYMIDKHGETMYQRFVKVDFKLLKEGKESGEV
jgi:hypothetical protein